MALHTQTASRRKDLSHLKDRSCCTRIQEFCRSFQYFTPKFLPFETEMNPAIKCIILLACVAICTSASIKKCLCTGVSKAVKSPIVEVKEYKPRPYCNKHEVIIKTKDNKLWCLDPTSSFTKQILQRAEMRKAATRPTSPKTTTVATTASVPTSS